MKNYSSIYNQDIEDLTKRREFAQEKMVELIAKTQFYDYSKYWEDWNNFMWEGYDKMNIK